MGCLDPFDQACLRLAKQKVLRSCGILRMSLTDEQHNEVMQYAIGALHSS